MRRRQSSIFSFGSLAPVTSKQDDSSYEDLTEAELRRALENVASTNVLLRMENNIFERYLARRDPESLQTIAQSVETAKRVQRIAAPQYGPTSPAMSVTGSVMSVRDRETAKSIISIQSGSRHVTPSLLTDRTGARGGGGGIGGGEKVPYAQRIEMANTEIRELSKTLLELERTSAGRRIRLRAHMEESEIGIRETCETREAFEENVVRKGVDDITGRIPAEKFIRFVEEWLKATGTVTERNRLKAATIKSQIRRAKLRLKRREELGEALRVVDFEQLNIENRNCVRRINEKNRYLLEMKKIAGSYSIALTRRKEKLNGLTTTVNEVRGKMAAKKREIERLRSERATIKIETEKVEAQLASLMTLMDDFTVPEVIDCVKMGAELRELQKIHEQLNRRRKIRQTMFQLDKRQGTARLRGDISRGKSKYRSTTAPAT